MNNRLLNKDLYFSKVLTINDANEGEDNKVADKHKRKVSRNNYSV